MGRLRLGRRECVIGPSERIFLFLRKSGNVLRLDLNNNRSAAMPKTLCDWSRSDYAKKAEQLHALTRESCYFCGKCGRVANTKKVLCRASLFKIDKIERFVA